MEVSRTSINVASITETAINHGFSAGLTASAIEIPRCSPEPEWRQTNKLKMKFVSQSCTKSVKQWVSTQDFCLNPPNVDLNPHLRHRHGTAGGQNFTTLAFPVHGTRALFQSNPKNEQAAQFLPARRLLFRA